MKKKNDENDSSQDEMELNPEDLIKKLLSNSSVDVVKGDKIRVFKGDLKGLTGQVVSIEKDQVVFKPNYENFKENLIVDASYVAKYFEPGDDVRVIEG